MSNDSTPSTPKTVKVRLVRKTRGHALGEVVEVSPARAARLLKDRHAVKAN